MSIRFAGDHAVPPEVAEAAADSGLGEVKAAHLVPHKVVAPGEEQQAKRAELRNGLLVIAALAAPLLVALLLWWATGSIGTGIGVGAALVVIGLGVVTYLENRSGKERSEDLDRVFLFDDGFVLPAEGESPVRAFRWADVAAVHRTVTDNYVNRQPIFTRYSYRLVLEDGTPIVFQGNELPNKPSPTEIRKLAPVLEEEVCGRRLPLAVEAVNAGGTVQFGALAISSAGVTTPKGHLPWTAVGELSIGAGTLFVDAAGRKPEEHPIGDIPNFQVFWTLAENLRAHHAG
jgi:hypothetical protein